MNEQSFSGIRADSVAGSTEEIGEISVGLKKVPSA